MRFQQSIFKLSVIFLAFSSQIVSAEVIGPCGQPLPENQSREASEFNLSCGVDQTISYNRVQEPVSAAIESKWIELQNSGSPNNREERQKLRYTEAKMTGQIPVVFKEIWSYMQTEYGRFSVCPLESYVTTCTDPIYQTETYEESYCAEYEQEPSYDSSSDSSSSSSGSSSSSDDSSSSSSSSTYDSGSSSSSSTYDSGSSSSSSTYDSGSSSSSSYDSGSSSSSAGESSSSISNSYDSKGGSDDSFQNCIRYATTSKERQVKVGDRSYSCTQQRNSECSRDQKHTVSRVCSTRNVPYSVEYRHDPTWKPGYTSPKGNEGDYYDILPNKFDLLPGESETGLINIKVSQSAQLTPTIKVENIWNQYKTSIDPTSQLSCSQKEPMSVHFNIDTIGRIKRKAPNYLSVPVDEKGNKIAPLTFETVRAGKGRPIKVTLQDNLRATYLAAAKDSRLENGNPPTAADKTDGFIFKLFGKNTTAVSRVSFWAQTEFRLQLFRKDRWKRWVRVTLPMKFNSDKGDILGDSVVISLEAQDGLDRFYRPAAPLDTILGGLYKKFGVELSPGTTYYLKIQSAVKGLPFYLMGCRGGDDVCEDKEPQDSYYSEPVVIEFQTDADTRSWFKRFLDFQEKLLIF